MANSLIASGFQLLLLFLLIPLGSMEAQEDKEGDVITFMHSAKNKTVDIFIHGDYFSSYRYESTWKKPVLYPLITKKGIKVTRGYPIEPQPGERHDHPHHVGFWLNYGDVNGLDFWNNSNARKNSDHHKYGEIQHDAIIAIESREESGRFKCTARWMSPEGKELLMEKTVFSIAERGDTRIVDRWTELTAVDTVHFSDNKEGMVAVRVAKELELPSNKPIAILGSNLEPLSEKVVDTVGRKGDYLSSEGVKGKEVWGTRATWMQLKGQIGGDEISLVLLDHPDNVGYPTYWHARDYGLFSANPLGQKVFSKGEHELNFKLNPGEKGIFQYRLLIHEGPPLTAKEIAVFQKEFSGRK